MLLIADFPYKPQRKVSLLDVQSALGASVPTATREKKKANENWTGGRWISLSVPELWPNPKLWEKCLKQTDEIPNWRAGVATSGNGSRKIASEWNRKPSPEVRIC